MPDTSLWCRDSAYDYWDNLAPEGVAWEFLRRNPSYQDDYRSGAVTIANWGLRSAIDPEVIASESPVHWAPSLTSSDVLLSSMVVPVSAPGIPIDAPTAGLDNAGGFSVIGHGASELHLSFLDGQMPSNGVLCVIVPLDADMPERIAALHRMWRLLHNHPAPDLRLSRDKRHRRRQMVRALDGRDNGASVRDIATALFGARRADAHDWRTSSIRYSTLRLLRDGQQMIDGGYLELLHARHADNRRKRLPALGVRK